MNNKAPTEYEEQESEAFHGDPLTGAESIAATEAVTAERFHARLRAELDRRGVHYASLKQLTFRKDAPPPCFKLTGADYDAWLASASLLGATVPYRYDMPGEPNYCFDCTAEFKKRACAVGACQFPNTRFERVQTVIRDEQKKIVEVETVGVSRRRHIPYPEDAVNV